MSLPEGLTVVSSPTAGELLIVDPQDHVWVTLHGAGFGDPAEWQATIFDRVTAALDIFGSDREPV